MIASAAYPDLVGTYWKGSCTPNVIQNGKMVETWHVVEGWPLKIQEKTGEV
jgi:hypothetical protein